MAAIIQQEEKPAAEGESATSPQQVLIVQSQFTGNSQLPEQAEKTLKEVTMLTGEDSARAKVLTDEVNKDV